jgi:hypothetical protein
MQRLHGEYNDLVNDWPYLAQYPINRSRIRSGVTAIRDVRSDYRHIEFNATDASIGDKVKFKNLLMEELQLRGVVVARNCHMEELRSQLSEYLMIEMRYKLLKEVLEKASIEEAMIKLEKALPCLLHLENRISDHILTLLLRVSLNILEGDKGASENFIKAIEDLVNESYFGHPGCRSNWKFPINDDGSMGEVKFANWRARRVIEHFDQLVDVCVTDEDEQVKWKSAGGIYRRTIQALQQKTNFTDANIDAFQDMADDFFKQWTDLVGYDGITNYVHMLGAGHIRYYLTKWRNLNRFQNQGWESYNQHVAAFWNHRTQKGGNKVDRSKIKPIARWLLRLMMWKTGEGDKFFQNLETNNLLDDPDDLSSDSSDEED